MSYPSYVKPSEIPILIKSLFNSQSGPKRSYLITCPSCQTTKACVVTKTTSRPVWFYCTSCKFSGDLLEAVTGFTKTSESQAISLVSSMCPSFAPDKLLASRAENKKKQDAFKMHWERLLTEQNYALDCRRFLAALPIEPWRDYLNQHLVTQPVPQRNRLKYRQKKMLIKVQTRPGLPSGVRPVHGVAHFNDFFGRGVAFLEGACQPESCPVPGVIVTQDIAWATSRHGEYWQQNRKAAPIVVPLGDDKTLHQCFGNRVRSMVAWASDPTQAVALGMLYDCLVSHNDPQRDTPLKPHSSAKRLADIVDNAKPWYKTLSQLITGSSNLYGLLHALPLIPEDKISELSVVAQRRLKTKNAIEKSK